RDLAALRNEPRVRHHARAGDARRDARRALRARGAARGGTERPMRQSLRVLAVALVIAVASVSSVAFLGDRVSRAIARDANQLLGADLVLLSDRPWGK